MAYGLRIELWCGGGGKRGLRAAERRYTKADAIARKHNIETFFELGQDTMSDPFHADGYVYPNSDNLLQVMDDLKKAGVEYDTIDMPDVLEGSSLHKAVLAKVGKGMGVGVEFGYNDYEPTTYSAPFEGFDWEYYEYARPFRRPSRNVYVHGHRRRRA